MWKQTHFTSELHLIVYNNKFLSFVSRVPLPYLDMFWRGFHIPLKCHLLPCVTRIYRLMFGRCDRPDRSHLPLSVGLSTMLLQVWEHGGFLDQTTLRRWPKNDGGGGVVKPTLQRFFGRGSPHDLLHLEKHSGEANGQREAWLNSSAKTL